MRNMRPSGLFSKWRWHSTFSLQEPNEFFADFTAVYTKMLHTGIHHHLEVSGGSCSTCTEPIVPPSCALVDRMKTALLELFTPLGGDLQHSALRLGTFSLFSFSNMKCSLQESPTVNLCPSMDCCLQLLLLSLFLLNIGQIHGTQGHP